MQRLATKPLVARPLMAMALETKSLAAKAYARARAFCLGLFGKVPAAAFAAAGVAIAVLIGASLIPQDRPEQGSIATEQKSEAQGRDDVRTETRAGMFAMPRTPDAVRLAGPTPADRLLSMPLIPADLLPASGSGPAHEGRNEPNLAGLSEVPKDMIWDRLKEEENEGKDKERTRPSFAAFSEAREQLPWDAIEPVPFTPVAVVKHPPAGSSRAEEGSKADLQTAAAPANVGNWLKTKVTEIKGAARSRPLYHFELWLEAPAAVKQQLAGVTYEFSTPAIRPQSQASSNSGTGFRISAGGLACPDEIVVTVRFVDGRVERVSIDGCELLS